MFRMGSWLAPKTAKHQASSRSLNSLDEPKYLEEALRAATYIINDDVEAAEEGLNKGNSSFHKLGRGIVLFIKATLGFEQDVMRDALDCINDAESTASNDLRRAQRDANGGASSLYPPGSEFALCQAESQLLCAVVAVLTESLTESLKGFYKLRKAYMTLNGLLEEERKFSKTVKGGNLKSGAPSSVASGVTAPSEVINGEQEPILARAVAPEEQSTSSRSEKPIIPGSSGAQPTARQTDKDDDEVFYDADDAGGQPNLAGSQQSLDDQVAGLKIESGIQPEPSASRDFAPDPSEHENNGQIVANPVDIFIQSGSNLCFGLLLVMISMIPPAFGKLLSIVGFKGDRERGLKMLWQATKFNNINGAMAGLVLLGFYNGIAGFCDILPDDPEDLVDGHPIRRCKELLVDMRGRYPKSRLWLLEEARMLTSEHRLDEANELLKGSTNSQLKQIDALAMFERSLNSLYMHRHEEATQNFVQCVGLNSWSHAMYYYNAGASQIEMYRKLKQSDPPQAASHAKLAEEYLMKVPSLAGKKRIMARQLPFDIFVLRKIRKWQQRAQELGVEFVDAVGVSPAEEMVYLWNGYKRMQPSHLQDSLEALSWSETQNARWPDEPVEEKAILALLRAAIMRTLGRVGEARRILQDHVIACEPLEFKGPLKDDWTAPSAHYEMAVICWMERAEILRRRGGGGGSGDGNEEAEVKIKMKECAEWLEKVARWESFTLDARIGLKVTTAQGTLRKYSLMA